MAHFATRRDGNDLLRDGHITLDMGRGGTRGMTLSSFFEELVRVEAGGIVEFPIRTAGATWSKAISSFGVAAAE